MQRLGSRATYINLSGNDSNALDFHIAFYTGILVTRDPYADIYVISKDTGFDPLLQHIRSGRFSMSTTSRTSTTFPVSNGEEPLLLVTLARHRNRTKTGMLPLSKHPLPHCHNPNHL